MNHLNEPKEIRGRLDASGIRAGILVTRWNEFITRQLLNGAIDALIAHGSRKQDIDIVWCPGAFEMPVVLRGMADSGSYDILIALGAVIRGETPHFDYVAGEASSGIARVSSETGIPCGFGLLTLETIEQGIARAGSKGGNKGWEAALAAIETLSLIRIIKGEGDSSSVGD